MKKQRRTSGVQEKVEKVMPPRPPQSVGEVVLWETMTGIGKEVIADYVTAIYGRCGESDAAKRKGTEAIFRLAAVGFAFWNWSNDVKLGPLPYGVTDAGASPAAGPVAPAAGPLSRARRPGARPKQRR